MRWTAFPWMAVGAVLLFQPMSSARADTSFADIVRRTNPCVVKVFGAGGFRGITAYCTGVLISPDGYILTVYSPTLDSRELRVHLYDGRRMEVELIAAEPVLDVALLRIKERDQFKAVPLPYIDLRKRLPTVEVGDWVLAFSNQFEIATRDEPVSVQRGVVVALTPLTGRRGINEAVYKGRAIIVDAIICNPGSHGGLLTTRRGEPIGLIGKELKNSQSDTWVNYAMPLEDLRDFADKAMRGSYTRMNPTTSQPEDRKAFHGILFVPDVLDRTPPYVEAVLPQSPAERAGLKPDDLIVFVRIPSLTSAGETEEKVIASNKSFKETVAPLEPGTVIKVIVRRGGQLIGVDLTLGNPVK
jgi:S1-C subfamily serine protease